MKKAIDFTYIRYANCWEDAGMLLRNTKPLAGERILSIASGGDNSLAFLAFDPAEVVAFDLNPAQLYLTELKQVAIKNLQYEEVLCFLGFKESENREANYQLLLPHLSEEASAFFNKHLILISNGIVHQGKFENYFCLFRKYIMPMVHSKSTIDLLFQPRAARDQEVFYNQQWNTLPWRLLFRFFFSKFILGRFGRDPAFFDEVKQGVSKTIFGRAETHLKRTEVAQNFFLDYQLRGKFSIGLPFYLRAENFDKIKQNIGRLQLFQGSLLEISREQKFDVLNLSNIFEYMDAADFRTQADLIYGICNENARIAYWNLLVERKLPAIDTRFADMPADGVDLCFFYQSFNLNTIK